MRNAKGTTDGQFCEQGMVASVKVESTAYKQTVKKPTLENTARLKLALQVDGEHNIRVSCSMNVSINRAGKLVQNGTRSWKNCEGSKHSFFGHELVWLSSKSPGNIPRIDLSPEKLKYQERLEMPFAIKVNCSDQVECVRDGDVVNTHLMFNTDIGLRIPDVRIESTVQSVASCEKTFINLDPVSGVISQSAGLLAVTVLAFDANGLPITHSVPHFQVQWDTDGNQFNRTAARKEENKFEVQIPKERRGKKAVYRLRVVLQHGVRHGAESGECVLKAMVVTVTAEEDVNMHIVQGVAFAVVLLLCAGLFLFLIRKNPGL